jgi:hypothetical protein
MRSTASPSKAGTIHHLADTGEQGYAGDSGAAGGPKGLARGGGRLFVADTVSHVIRSIALDTGIITTVVGTGQRGDGPEPNPLQCALSRPHCIFVDRDDALYVLDSEAHRIRVLI